MSLRNTNLKLVCPISPALFGAQDIPPLFLTGTLWQSHHLTFGEEQRSFPDNREFNSFKRVLCQSATAQLDALIDAAMEFPGLGWMPVLRTWPMGEDRHIAVPFYFVSPRQEITVFHPTNWWCWLPSHFHFLQQKRNKKFIFTFSEAAPK